MRVLVKIQVGLLAIRLYNLVLNLLPGSHIRRFFLNATGSNIGRGTGIHSVLRLTWIGNLHIGQDSTINFGCFIDNRAPIVMGSHVMIGHNCRIYTTSHDLDSGDFAQWKKEVRIDDYAVVFPNSLIMPGVRIGQGGVVLPGSVVTRDVPEWTVVGGNPATPRRQRASDQRYRIDYQYLFINS
jgi:acetyltransferase-like isoleucine patch superfamily enzyme